VALLLGEAQKLFDFCRKVQTRLTCDHA
jgi:hypothetical protein